MREHRERRRGGTNSSRNPRCGANREDHVGHFQAVRARQLTSQAMEGHEETLRKGAERVLRVFLLLGHGDDFHVVKTVIARAASGDSRTRARELDVEELWSANGIVRRTHGARVWLAVHNGFLG